MTKKVAIIGGNRTVLSRKAPKEPDIIPAIPEPVLFKDLNQGQRFIYKKMQMKKVSSFAAYRNGFGLYSVGSKTVVEPI